MDRYIDEKNCKEIKQPVTKLSYRPDNNANKEAIQQVNAKF